MITEAQSRHYLFEVLRESEVFEDSHQSFVNASDQWLEANFARERTGVLIWQGTVAERAMMAALEGMLSPYARISLFFFPQPRSGAFSRERGRVLRSKIGIDEDHPLSDRELRNHWMHLDERLDKAVERGEDVPVGYLLNVKDVLTPKAIQETFRLVDPGSATVYIFGKAFHIEHLARTVAHVGQETALALTADGSA